MTKDQLYALDLLIDDNYALWDFGGGLPQFVPDAGDTKNAELLELVRLGFVRVTFGYWHVNDTLPCDQETATSAIANPSMWLPTDGKPGFIVEITNAGQQELKLRGIGIS